MGFISGDSVVSRSEGQEVVSQEEASGQACACSGKNVCICRNCGNFYSFYLNIQRGVEGRNGSEGTVGV